MGNGFLDEGEMTAFGEDIEAMNTHMERLCFPVVEWFKSELRMRKLPATPSRNRRNSSLVDFTMAYVCVYSTIKVIYHE